MPPATNPMVARTKSTLANQRVVASPRRFEKSHEFPDQPISGWKATSMLLRVKYHKWTKPCSTMKISTRVIDMYILPCHVHLMEGVGRIQRVQGRR